MKLAFILSILGIITAGCLAQFLEWNVLAISVAVPAGICFIFCGLELAFRQEP